MIFVTQGQAPLSQEQLHNRTQSYIDRDWPVWKRERSMRKADGEFSAYIDGISADNTANVSTNLFNTQLASYNTAVSRLAQYVVADGRVELTEMQATGEQVFNEETMEMDDVMAEVITQSAIEPVDATVEIMLYSDDAEPVATASTITNPLITTDTTERAEAQAVVDATPAAVITASGE